MYIQLQGTLVPVESVKKHSIHLYNSPIPDVDSEDGYYYVRFSLGGPEMLNSRKFETKELAEEYLAKIVQSIHYFLLSEKVGRD